MDLFEVLLGVDYAARDTGRRIKMVVRESDVCAAALKAEKIADSRLEDQATMYTHAMRVTPVVKPAAAAAALPLAMAA